MREVAATLDELGFDGDLARAVASPHDALGALDAAEIADEPDPFAALAALLPAVRPGAA